MRNRLALEFQPLTPADAAFAAEAESRQAPHHPVDVDDVLRAMAGAEATGSVRRLIVVSQGGRIGWLSVVVPGGGHGHGYLNVIMPGASADAIADVYALAEEHAREAGVSEGVTEVWEDLEVTLSVLAERGWAVRRNERYWRLQLGPAASRLRGEHAVAAARVARGGIDVVPASTRGVGEEVYRQLYEIHEESHLDIPRSVTYVGHPWEMWLRWMEPPAVLPDRVWVAFDGDRAVGYSHLTFRSNGKVDTGYTGVLRDYRGRGVARAVKLATLVQALDLGIAEVETDNDSENGPIIHLNQDLGYEPIPGRLELAKQLG